MDLVYGTAGTLTIMLATVPSRYVLDDRFHIGAKFLLFGLVVALIAVGRFLLDQTC